MAGIYIHVPFCSSRCIYCDFYSTTYGEEMRWKYVRAACAELAARRQELAGQQVETIYWGGGTPSQLLPEQQAELMDTLFSCYAVAEHPEVTLECNPDDVTGELAVRWRSLGFNRVSMGVQTFRDDLLRLLRRRHTAATVDEAVRLLRAAGFCNLTLDLIYGLPGQTFADWQQDVQRLLAMPVQHLSAYALSYEPGTALSRMLERHEVAEADEELVRKMYLYLIAQTRQAGFEHYEISNFAREGYRSRHNSSYWSGIPYLGIGPGAHSYDGAACRRANLPDLQAYVAAEEGNVPHQLETLDRVALFEEYLLTGLRTAQGISLAVIDERFGSGWAVRLGKIAEEHLRKGNLLREGDRLRLSLEGILISDYVISDLMMAGDS